MRLPINIAITVFIALIFSAIVFRVVDIEQRRDAELNRFSALQELSTIRARIEGLLNANLISMRSLQVEFSLNPEVDNERFNTLTGELLTGDLHTRHVAIAPDLVISNVFPLAGNEGALGLDYQTTSAQYASIQAAMEAKEIVVNGPIELVQGGTALIARVPVYHYESGAFWGVISQVIEHEELLDDAGLYESNLFDKAIRGINGSGSSGAHISGTESIWTHKVVTTQVTLPYGEWTLGAFPKTGSWELPMSSYTLHWVIGGIITIAFSLLVFTLLNNFNRLQVAFNTISHQARYDSLTALPNRHYFMQVLADNIREKARFKTPFAVLFIDLDHFKEINDSLGHEAGDELLIEVGNRLKATLRGSDLVARFGGDEFVVILHDLDDPIDAEFLANKILQSLSPTIEIANHDVMIQGSIGIAIYPEDGSNSSDLIKHADLAMYAAKSAGRGTSYFFNDSLRNQAESHLQLHREILKGLEDNQFRVFYQPIIEYTSRSPNGEIAKIEALIRWNHPEYGIVSPCHFIPIAEKTGTIRELGEFVLNQACEDYHKLCHQGMKLPISINRSSREFNDPKASQNWLRTIDEFEVPRSDITFEITESILMPDKERQHQMLTELTDSGVTLSIDDFGTGYSSVTYLRNFPVSQIKIDRAFLLGIPENAQQLALVEAIIKMASALELDVVAEGIEKQNQAMSLKRMGCTYMQGFLYARPLAIEDLVNMYRPNTGVAAERVGAGQ